MIRSAPFLALCLMAAAASAQTVAAPPPATTSAPALPRVSLTTSAGIITIALEAQKAPVTVANFLKYVDGKRFDGTSFYRALRFPGDVPAGLIQGGVRGDPRRSLPPIADEPTSRTGLTHDDGAISMARAAPGSAQGDFFIIIGAGLGTLDASPPNASPADPGYAVFGHVVEGMEVVKSILGAPTSPTEGEGAMRGQIIAAPIRIIGAARVK